VCVHLPSTSTLVACAATEHATAATDLHQTYTSSHACTQVHAPALDVYGGVRVDEVCHIRYVHARLYALSNAPPQLSVLVFCTSKASKLSTWRPSGPGGKRRTCSASSMSLQPGTQRRRRQYLYFCSSKASKVSTWRVDRADEIVF
jgi:ribosomal protein L24E